MLLFMIMIIIIIMNTCILISVVDKIDYEFNEVFIVVFNYFCFYYCSFYFCLVSHRYDLLCELDVKFVCELLGLDEGKTLH